MSQGTLYAGNKARVFAPKALIKHFKLDVKVEEPGSETFKKAFPLGKQPGFIGPKGFTLQETIAISFYLVSIADPESKLLGTSVAAKAKVLQWMSLSNSDFLGPIGDLLGQMRGTVPYNKKVIETSQEKLAKVVPIFERRLAEFTYLVGERLTLADVFCASLFIRGFDFFFGSEWRKQYPGVTRWFKTVISLPILKDLVGDYKFLATPKEIQPPKKEKKAAAVATPAKKAEKKPQPKDEDDEPAAAPKPKHPLEALGKPTAALDDWKRTYSNEETREVAIPYFWDKQFNADEWSLWKVDYKYNDELTLTFMSNNLVGGFFNRLGASAKYMFGTMVVYGENNNNGITGFFLVRGQEHEPAFDVAPDWESYAFTKLDASDEASKKFINNMLAWDEPVEFNGEKREIADGKVFK